MGNFRIGRKHAQHSYPTPRALGGVRLARNFASTFKESFDLPAAEEPIPWSAIDSVSPWDAGTTYATGEIVSHLGTTWISQVDGNVGNAPPDPGIWEQNTIVPITPISTGVVIIQGVICVENQNVGPEELVGEVRVNGVALTVPLTINVSLSADIVEAVVPFLAEVRGLPLGVRADVELALAANNLGGIILETDCTTMEVREMQAATG